MVDSVASLDINVRTNDVDKADSSLQKLTTTGKKTEAQVAAIEREVKQLGVTGKRAANEVGSSFARNNASIQNAAFQFQDLAVQIEGGVAPSRALAQQIPQLLGGFGAVGAVTGLVAGLAATLAGPLVDGLFESITSTENLEKALEALSDTITMTSEGTLLLTDEFGRLSKESQDLAEVQLRARLISAAEASNAAFASLKDTLNDFDDAIRTSGRGIAASQARLNSLAKEYGLTANEVAELARLTREAVDSKSLEDIQKLRDRITELGISTAKDSEEFIKFAQSVNEGTAAMERQAEITSLLNEAINDQTAVIQERTQAGIDQTAELEKQAARAAVIRERELEQLEREEQRLEAHFDRLETQRERDLQRQEAAADREQRVQRSRLRSVTSFTQNSLSVIENGAEEGSAIQKAAFLANQAVAIPSMIVSTEEAATQALSVGGPIAGPILSGAIRALGYASIGIAAGQTVGAVAGRHQGGNVSSNEPFMVGERGPELFVPGNSGRIINNNQMKNQSSGEMNIQIINQTTGRIDNVVQQQLSRNDVVLIIQETMPAEAANPNSRFSKTMTNNTSTKRRLS